VTARRTLRERLAAGLNGDVDGDGNGDGSRPAAAPATASTQGTEPQRAAASQAVPPPRVQETDNDVPAPPAPLVPPVLHAPEEPTGPTLIGPVEAVLRHPYLALLPVVVLIGVALAVTLARSPQYTAEARLNVGRIDVPAYTLPGVIYGNQSLAQSYARAITAPAVVNSATRAVNISGSTARSRLTATPVPQSTVIRVDATGASEESAIALANAAGKGLTTYVIKLNQNAQANTILGDFQRAQRDVDAAQRRLGSAQRSGSAATAQQAQLTLQTAQLKASTLEQRYRFESGNEAPPNLVQMLSPATTATSDFSSRLQEVLLIGLVAGVVVGLALALLRANAELVRGRA